MRYLALIYGSEAAEPKAGSPESQQMYQDYATYTDEVGKAGVMKGGDALQPIATATTVRVRNGQTVTTDGPFAETKEFLGGFYELECKDLDEAIHWAAKIPGAKYGSIEIRPIQEM